jgi:microbial collagenase
MIIKKGISLIALSLTSYLSYAAEPRDGALQSVDDRTHDVQHIRSTDIYAAQPHLSPQEKAERSKSVKPTRATKTDSLKSIRLLKKKSSSLTKSTLSQAAVASIEGCSSNVFLGLSGTAFLNALRSNGQDCIDTLFNDKPETLALGAYSDANFATVINEIKAKTITYNGTDPDEYLGSLYYWLKAYAYYDFRRFVTPTSQQAITEAINALYVNSHFFDKTAENASVIRSATSILKNAEIGERFVHIVKDVLSRFDESYEDVTNWGSAVTPLFWQSLQSCATDATCRAQEHNLTLVNAITSFIYSNIDWLSKSANDYHLFNLGYQLVNLHRGHSDQHFPAIADKLAVEINKVLTTYGPLREDKARTLYMAVFESIDYNRVCSTYNTCQLKEELITAVLDDRMTCPSGTLAIWAQDMNQAQLEWTCNSLGAHETYFHTTLQTNETPVTPDDNDKLQMIIFNDKKEWVTYGGALFNVSTSNGGTYREGDPSNGTPEATFYAYEDVPERPIFDVWNLRHEYIHYLEGRFISKGSFRDSDDAGRTTWFGEGIAEFISLRNCNAGAIEEAKTEEYALSTIFNNEYGVGQTRIYDWGYLSNRYMFENENAKFFSMLEVFKQGDFDTYRTDMVDTWIDNKSFDSDFSNWLTTVNSTGCTIDNTRPESPIEPINVDEIQGNEQVGINACALGRAPESRDIQPGKAICLTDTSNKNQVQLGLNVPSGLVNVDLEITLRHGNGNADLLHRWDNRPNSTTYDHISNLASNEESILVESVEAGWNYIHVPANTEFSEVTLLARYIQNDIVADNVLENGVSKTVSGTRLDELRFTIEVPEGASSLTFDTSGGTGDADLYVKYDSEPTLNDFDCRPYDNGSNEHCKIEDIQAGTYHVMLQGYKDFTDVNIVGNYTTDEPNDSGLQNGTVELVSGVTGSEASYTMKVPAGASNLSFNTSGGSGDLDMHVKFGSEATKTDYDCRPWKVGSNETCVFTNVQAGTYYIMLLGHNDYNNVELLVSYSQ